MRFLLWLWPLCLLTPAFKPDQNQRRKLTCPPAPASFIPYRRTPRGSALSDEDASGTVRGFEVQVPAGEVERLLDKAWQQGQRRVRGGQWSWAGGWNTESEELLRFVDEGVNHIDQYPTALTPPHLCWHARDRDVFRALCTRSRSEMDMAALMFEVLDSVIYLSFPQLTQRRLHS